MTESIFWDILDVRLVAELAVKRNFAKVADALHLPRTSVSKRLMAIEHRANTRLFERTTRRVNVTAAGEMMAIRCATILDELEMASQSLEGLTGRPRGDLRITAPFILGQALLGPLMPEFMKKHPEVCPLLDLTNQPGDMISEGIDVSVRLGPLADSTLIAKSVGMVEAGLYLAKSAATKAPFRQLPKTDKLTTLNDLPCLMLGRADESANEIFVFRADDAKPNPTEQRVVVKTMLKTNDPQTLLNAALSGLGFVVLPIMNAAPAVREGKLIPILPDWRSRRSEVFLVTPSRRHQRPAVKAFIEFVSERLSRVLLASSECALKSTRRA